MRSWQLRNIILSCVLSLGLVSASQAAVRVTFEGPGDGDDVAGVQLVRGWTFSDAGTITTVSFLIDGTLNTVIPCCSERQDVAAAFPGQANARNSGFGLTLNFNLLTPGSHTLTIRVQDSSGDVVSRVHTVTVVRPGGFEFVDLVDLSSATVSREGQDLLLSGLQMRAAGSGQVAQVDVRLRWLRQLQGLGIVASTTLNAVQAPPVQGPQQPLILIRPQTGAGSSGLVAAAVESPRSGQTGAGVAVIRGFAAAAAGRSIARVQLFLDGNPSLTIPCCSARGDVATAFPGQPNARNSGFGITFNFGVLTTGVHQLIIEIEDSAGALRKIARGILVRRAGDFEFLDSLDLSQSTASLQGQTLMVEGAIARDSATNQTVRRTLRYRYNTAAQWFSLLDSHGQVVVIDNLGAEENGDISSLDALQNNPGPDGISLLEAIEATDETPPQEPVLIVFPLPGTVQSTARAMPRRASVASVTSVTSGQFEDGDIFLSIFSDNITLDGDVDGDGTPDVTLSQVCLEIFASNITVRGLTFTDASFSPLFVSAAKGTASADVALVDNTVGSVFADPIITMSCWALATLQSTPLASGGNSPRSPSLIISLVAGLQSQICPEIRLQTWSKSWYSTTLFRAILEGLKSMGGRAAIIS